MQQCVFAERLARIFFMGGSHEATCPVGDVFLHLFGGGVVGLETCVFFPCVGLLEDAVTL